MIMIIIPTKQISKLKMNTLTMKIAMTRLLSKKHQKEKHKNTSHQKEEEKTKRYHGLNKQLILFEYFIHQIIFIFVVLIFLRKIQKNATPNANCTSVTCSKSTKRCSASR